MKDPELLNPEEKEQSRRYNPPRLQAILQSYSNQNSMALIQKQTYGSMEQNREPRNKPIHLWSINLQQRRQEYTMGKDSLFSKWCGESQPHVNQSEVRTHALSIHKNKLKLT